MRRSILRVHFHFFEFNSNAEALSEKYKEKYKETRETLFPEDATKRRGLRVQALIETAVVSIVISAIVGLLAY